MHAELLARLLPPASVDARGAAIGAELAAEGHALDLALGTSDQGLAEADPFAAAATMADWERVYGLPDPALPVVLQTLSAGWYALRAADLATFSRASGATFVDASGLVASAANDVPRVTPNGLLIEAGATNLLSYSEQFENAFWFRARLANVLANVASSPNGNLTAEKMVENTSNGAHYVYANDVPIAANTAYTFSVHLKAAERTKALLNWGNGSGSNGAWASFDLSGSGAVIGHGIFGSCAGVSYAITALSGGWYRCSITAVVDASSTTGDAWVCCLDGAGAQGYTGDGTSGLVLWGAQLELGGAPTSYIATTSSSGSRAADSASIQVLPTLAERRASLVAKIRLLGGQSIAFFVALASALGYAITITECHPQSSEDDSEYEVRDEPYRFLWIVNAALFLLRESSSEDDSEMATAVWGNGLLEAFFNRYKPAHTFVLFAYS